MLDETDIRAAIDGLRAFDWETADLDEVGALGVALGWDELEYDEEVMATVGDFLDDGWIAAGVDEDEQVFEVLVLVHLWDVEGGGEPTDEAGLLEAAYDRAYSVCCAELGPPEAEEARPIAVGDVTLSGRIAHWHAGDGVVSLYLGLRDDEFGPEVSLFSEAADEGWPKLEFLGT